MYLMASTDTGLVQRFDVRKGSGSKPLFTLDAHTDAVSVVAHNPKHPDIFLTASHDKTVKLWSLQDQKPAVLATKKLDVGAVFSAAFFMDSPFIVAVGGQTGKIKIWDSRESDSLRAACPAAEEGYSEHSRAVAQCEEDADESDHEMEEDQGLEEVEEESESEDDGEPRYVAPGLD